MRWTRGHESPDVIDRRGDSGRGVGAGALVGLFGLLGRSRLGWVGALVVIGGLVLFQQFGGALLGGDAAPARGSSAKASSRSETELVQFVSFVLDDAQQTWQQKFAERGATYQKTSLVLFTGETSTGCGYGDAATGPFYCPQDRRVYIDLSFYRELERRLGAPGDFAQAYVIAHEIGHHVQNILGISARVHRAPSAAQKGAEGLSVRLELQADCFAGIWAKSTQRREIIEQGDLEEAMNAAAAIGDDRLQERSSGRVRPESWTHGSSKQRASWFLRGFERGSIDACDTFVDPT
jgi:uncharacterized protein